MPSISFETVRALAKAFPDLEESTMYGAPAIKLGKRMVACIPSHRSAEPNSLAVRTTFDQRDALLSEAPETYYIKEHYRNYPVVLVRFAAIHRDQLRDLLTAARLCVLAGVKPSPTTKRATRRIP
ncbi:MAG: hypothetical protein ABI759_13490 [Candidatus Solibacter sp.]